MKLVGICAVKCCVLIQFMYMYRYRFWDPGVGVSQIATLAFIVCRRNRVTGNEDISIRRLVELSKVPKKLGHLLYVCSNCLEGSEAAQQILKISTRRYKV